MLCGRHADTQLKRVTHLHPAVCVIMVVLTGAAGEPGAVGAFVVHNYCLPVRVQHSMLEQVTKHDSHLLGRLSVHSDDISISVFDVLSTLDCIGLHYLLHVHVMFITIPLLALFSLCFIPREGHRSAHAWSQWAASVFWRQYAKRSGKGLLSRASMICFHNLRLCRLVSCEL
jgi:hypothetical protein